MLLRYPELQDVTKSRIGIAASARAKVAAFMQADLVPIKKSVQQYKQINFINNIKIVRRFIKHPVPTENCK